MDTLIMIEAALSAEELLDDDPNRIKRLIFAV